MQHHHQQLLQQQHLQRMKPKPINGKTRDLTLLLSCLNHQLTLLVNSK